MHDHDLERIAAVAESRLTGSELVAAEAAIASCEQCARDLEDQRLALAFLAEASSPSLTELERAALHRHVRQSTSPKASRWVRLTPAFAAAAALVMVFGVVSLFGRGEVSSTQRLSDQDLTTAVAGKSEADTAPVDDGARELASPPVAAGLADDLPALAEELRSASPAFAATEEHACDTEAMLQANQPPTAVAETNIDGFSALLYVYPDLALAFDAESCDLIRRLP